MTSPDQAPAGMQVGEWTLLTRIGEGGMGVVHLARREDGKRAALKVLRPHVVGDEEARERLAREVRSLVRVRSRRIAEIVDSDPWGPVPFVATRYVPGLNLHDHVAQEGALSGDDLLEFARGLAEALHAVHRVGVLHRDIKPSNVLMEGRSPVLIDFGLARVADDSRLTRTGYLLGTPGYLAPEVLHGHEPSPAADIHAWGATVAFAGLGRSPFGKGPAMAVMDRVRRGEHDLDGLGFEVLGLVVAALDPDPEKRPQLAQLIARLGGEVTRERPIDGSDTAGPATMTMPLTPTYPSPDTVAPTKVDPTKVDPAGSDPTRVEPPQQPAPPPFLQPASAPYQQPPPPAAQPRPAERPISAPMAGPAAREVSWPERLRRWSLGVGLLGLVGAATAAAPWLASLVVAGVLVLCRSLSLSSTASVVRRGRRGPKWYDGALDVVAAPWHFLVSLPVSLVLVCWAAMLGASVALTGLILGAGDWPLLVVVGLVIGLSAWTGPGSARLRQPVASCGRPIAGNNVAWLVAMVLLVIVCSGLLAVATGPGTEWVPFDDAPWAGDSWLGRLSG